ncbi:hypothetical protein [Exiguobacterium antarcticum]|uniref:hypothetical protein n=1 Tax=Exiguobacterium antarcticum TaxID=132920 RepID=UPI00249C3659|nr:hypothetical protein [Exiguobacterium antarcticum]
MIRLNSVLVLLTIISIVWYLDSHEQIPLAVATFLGVFTVLSLMKGIREKSSGRHRD